MISSLSISMMFQRTVIEEKSKDFDVILCVKNYIPTTCKVYSRMILLILQVNVD